MEKTGPKHTEGFKKRWFTMDDRRLMYFKDPLDAYARGEVFIGSKENSYTVLPGLPATVVGTHWPFGITIVTPDRKFLFACETEEDQRSWMAAFQIVINRPMLPQEFAGSPPITSKSLQTTVVNLIRDDNDQDYREEVEQLVVWCRGNSLILNVEKTNEIIVDFRRTSPTTLYCLSTAQL
ncbi:PREDICTED: arf-GAP with dual PH domain-containing protein 1-like [Cyprinodon variegatus]|uniref:arf-GAP with dual PH domain-containing protein 1-like n=1 Tax=Cyprinodon variegatus TaxID=28743 RepID=UPI000742C5D9|nr:PREDICTED: arf-GAP with dual PH domain-containing protein 1-like [Cyprinodon variegatus]